MAKYLATSFAIEKVVKRAARDQQLFADLDNLNELGGIGVEIDHVPGFFGGLRAGVHGHADVGLRQSRRVVRSIAGHGDELSLLLLALDECHLVFGLGFREKIVDSGLGVQSPRRSADCHR